ncbi:MAG TPA: glycosyltransferase family 39 protein [Conexibacter sp.]|nr:glycosyltransferase family 39 protein [Conexibacter sp.]
MAVRLGAWGPYAVLAVALAFFGWCALTAIAHPGPQYDEVLFVNGALGGHYANGSFVSDRFLGVVTMLMPYIGALKSWLYAPLFEVFGVSMSTIRVPAIAASGATVCLAFVLARRLFGAWPAALLAVLMATDPTYIAMSKTDYGPIVLSGLLRVGALAAYFAWMRTGSVRYVWLLAGSVALGIFNKVDFLAFAGALALAAIVVDHRGIVRRVRERPRAFALVAVALLAVLVVEYIEIYAPARAFPAAKSGADLTGRLHEVWMLFRWTMDGTGFYQYMTGAFLGERTAVAPATVAVVVLAGALALWRLSRRGRRPDPAVAPLAATAKTAGFLLLLLLTIFVVLAATPQAVGPHHAMLLWPLPALLGVALVSAATQLRRPALRAGVTVVLVLGLVALAGSQIRVASTYRAAFASDRTWLPGWTTEAYPLANAVKRYAPGVDTIVTADWGIGNQLLALGDDDSRRRINDDWGAFAGGTPASIDQLAAATLRGHRAIVLMHVAGAEVMPHTTARAEAMIKRLHPVHPVEVLYRGRALLAYVVDDRR